MGSEESLELSSFVPANEGEGEGGGVAEPVDTFCSLPLLLEKKINRHYSEALAGPDCIIRRLCHSPMVSMLL